MADQITIENEFPFMLRGIYLAESSTKIANHFDPTFPGQELKGDFRIGAQRIQKGSIGAIQEGGEILSLETRRFLTKFEFKFKFGTSDAQNEANESKEPLAVAEIHAEFSAVYQLNPKAMPSEDIIKAWGSKEVILHVWPYWREFCAGMLSRMNLPALMMPLAIIDNSIKNKQ